MRPVAVFVLVLVGCGGPAFEDFLDEQRDANCGYYVRCGAFATVADCRAYYEAIELPNPSLSAAIDAGKIDYDEAAADACIEALDDLACDITAQPAGALAACDDVFSGTGRVGSACAFDGECTSDRCVVPFCEEACCQGTCEEARILPGVDEPCSVICAGDLFCGIDQLCHAPLGEGAPCDAANVCAAPLYCSGLAGYKCAPPAQTGARCDGACALEGDVCGPDGICIEAVVGGDPCGGLNECSRFYICNFDMGRCQSPRTDTGPLSPNGSPCTFNTECASHWCEAVCTDVPTCY